MTGDCPQLIRLVALFPHEDAAAIVQDFRSRLFKAGLLGAYSLPLCVPLGTAERGLSMYDLKRIAGSIRDSRSERFFIFGAAAIFNAKSGLAGVFGQPIIACPLSQRLSFQEIDSYNPFEEPALLLAAGSELPPLITEIPPFRFRAGFVANLVIRPMDAGEAGLSNEWKSGAPAWQTK